MRQYLLFIIVLLLSRIASAGLQTEIQYTAEIQSGNQWIYNYTVSNLALEEGISEFTIWFELGKYSSMQIVSDPLMDPDWNQIVWQPNQILTSNGGFDALAKIAPISIGQRISGFAVSFEWLGSGDPSRQYYEIINPNTYEVISNGYTIPIPEPVTAFFLLTGGILSLQSRRK